jgi:hypothetical protein
VEIHSFSKWETECHALRKRIRAKFPGLPDKNPGKLPGGMYTIHDVNSQSRYIYGSLLPGIYA